jgi:hypothetical protein
VTWKRAKISPRTLATKTSYYIMTMRCLTLPFSPGNFWPETTWLSYPTFPTFACFSD